MRVPAGSGRVNHGDKPLENPMLPVGNKRVSKAPQTVRRAAFYRHLVTFSSTTDADGPAMLPLTGERTVPGIAEENYWFRRHEAAYRWTGRRFCRELLGARIVDAGCGEGYGAAVLAAAAGVPVVGLELDALAASHAHRAYPTQVDIVAANLDSLPAANDAVDALVSMQVVEHLWNLAGFLAEALRVLRPGGLCVIATPNRLTFSPGLARGDRPTNPFHVEEFDADQLVAMMSHAGFVEITAYGLRHCGELAKWEQRNGDIVAAQIAEVLHPDPNHSWGPELQTAVAAVTCADFAITDSGLTSCADLIVVAHKANPAGRS